MQEDRYKEEFQKLMKGWTALGALGLSGVVLANENGVKLKFDLTPVDDADERMVDYDRKRTYIISD